MLFRSPIDGKKAKNNAESFAAFTKALGSYGGEARDTVFESITKGLLTFFGVDLPYDKFVEFSQLNIDGKKTKQNAEALVAFNKALASYKGEGRDTAFESMAKGMLKFFGVKLPVDKFVEFSKIEMNGKKVKQNAEALIAFNNALASYKGEGRDTAFESMAKGMLKFFGVKLPLDKFEEFAKIKMDGRKVKENAEAIGAFNKAIGSYKGEGRDTVFESMTKGMLKFFGVKLPLDKFEEFANLPINGRKVKQNAEAITAFNTAIASYKGEGRDTVFESMTKGL